MYASPGSLPDFKIMTLFGCGALLLIGVGCTINDLIYQDIDTKVAMGTMDGIIYIVSEVHLLLPLIGRKLVTESCIGGMKETQEMIDFAAKHNIKADVEVILMDFVNTAMGRLVKVNDRYKFAINIGNTLKPTNS